VYLHLMQFSVTTNVMPVSHSLTVAGGGR